MLQPNEVLLGLGANLGDPVAQLRRTVERLGDIVALEAVSSVYRTEPVGLSEQPDFFNLVCRCRTELSSGELVRAVLALEARLGRTRSVPNAPRTIDVDVLAHGEEVLESDVLVLPHPRLHRRAFVLVPLLEVAPGWIHPVLGRSAEALLAEMASPEKVERWGPLFDPG